METYILQPDAIGKKTLDHLAQAAGRGKMKDQAWYHMRQAT